MIWIVLANQKFIHNCNLLCCCHIMIALRLLHLVQLILNRYLLSFIHSNKFPTPHFQFDTVWLIDHVKLWNLTTIYFNKASLKFFLIFEIYKASLTLWRHMWFWRYVPTLAIFVLKCIKIGCTLLRILKWM